MIDHCVDCYRQDVGMVLTENDPPRRVFLWVMESEEQGLLAMVIPESTPASRNAARPDCYTSVILRLRRVYSPRHPAHLSKQKIDRHHTL
jgi:hypothetical protein